MSSDKYCGEMKIFIKITLSLRKIIFKEDFV